MASFTCLGRGIPWTHCAPSAWNYLWRAPEESCVGEKSVIHDLDLFENTSVRSGRKEPVGDRLRKDLLSHYAASEVSKLAKRTLFCEIVRNYLGIVSNIILELVKVG
jgi:hypothetical protein